MPANIVGSLEGKAQALLTLARIADRGERTAATKETFHAVGRSLLRAVLNELGVAGEVRSCKGGPAVLGEVVLHTDAVYVQFCVTGFGDGPSFMFRTCRGRNDYVGGENRWWAYERLARDPTEFVEVLKSLSQPRA